MDINSLMSCFFKTAAVAYACEKCPSKTATIRQYMTSMPRVLIVQLKRFDIDSNSMRSIKRSDQVLISQGISLGIYKQQSIAILTRVDSYIMEKTKAPEPLQEPTVIDLTQDHQEEIKKVEQVLNPKYRLKSLISHIGSSSVSGNYNITARLLINRTLCV